MWFVMNLTVLECDVATPTGKILAVDRILSVAKYAGEGRFREQPDVGEQFAKYTAALLGRESDPRRCRAITASVIDEQGVCQGKRQRG
jgi:hypothetical protein